ncbi:MAG: HEAT repeat domain-containing protein [Planctomycetes bacterium]|nr:HEAT repeat domain-containing protein [Planctomycetota bacterium]
MSLDALRGSRAAAVGLLLCLSLHAQGITWSNTLKGALDAARAKNTVVFIAIVMPGERGSDAMLERHYLAPEVVELSHKTINVKLEVGPSGTPPEDERIVRERWLKAAPDALLAAPNHLFVKPGEPGSDGELISSFAYEVGAGRLEWAFVDALKKVQPEFTWELSERARAPETLLYGETANDGTQPAPTPDEVKAAIKELKAGGWDFQKRLQNYRTVLSSDDPEALRFGQQEMRSLPGGFRRVGLMTVGTVSPKAWHGFAEGFLEDREPEMREEASRTLEQLAEPKAQKALRKQFTAEDDEKVRGRLLRAMVASAPGDKTVVKDVEKVLTKDKSAPMRVQAAMAAASLEDRATAQRLLKLGLADGAGNVRTAAAYGVAARRDADLKAALAEVKQKERDLEVSQWLSTAIEVLDGGDLRKFEPFLTQVVGDRTRAQAAKELRDAMDRRGRGRDGGNADPGKDGKGADGGKGSDGGKR